MRNHHCPHCTAHLARGGHRYPAEGMRCPSCRLVIGPGRAVALQDSAPKSSSAAGVIANAARRQALDGNPLTPEAAVSAIRHVCAAMGTRPERLRMLDYDAAVRDGITTIELAEILRTFTTWKNARAQSAVALPATAASDGSSLSAVVADDDQVADASW